MLIAIRGNKWPQYVGTWWDKGGRCCPPWAGSGTPPPSPCCRGGLGFSSLWALLDALSLPYRNSAAAESRQLLLGKLPAMLGKLPGRLGKLPAMLGELPAMLGKLPDIPGKLPGSSGQEGFPCHSRVQERSWQAQREGQASFQQRPFPKAVSAFVTGSEPFLSVCPSQGTPEQGDVIHSHIPGQGKSSFSSPCPPASIPEPREGFQPVCSWIWRMVLQGGRCLQGDFSAMAKLSSLHQSGRGWSQVFTRS